MKKEDKLKDLFSQMKMEDTSSNFEARLMNLIHQEATILARKKSKRGVILNLIAICAGIAAIIAVPFIVDINEIIGTELFRSFSSLKNVIPSLKDNTFIIMIGCIALFLLASNLIITKHLDHRHNSL